jgi:hypothetical protein
MPSFIGKSIQVGGHCMLLIHPGGGGKTLP